MSDWSSSVPSSPTLSEASLPSSVPPSPIARSAPLPDVAEDDRVKAAAIKVTANAAFAGVSPFFRYLSISYGFVAQNYLEAAELYSDAIALDPTDKTFWLNRAVSRIKLEEFGYAISDVSKYSAFRLVRKRFLCLCSASIRDRSTLCQSILQVRIRDLFT